MRIPISLVLLAFVAAPASLSAGEDVSTAGIKTLDEAVAFGLANNPGLQAAWSQYRAALEKIPQAKGLPDPKIMVNHFVEDIQTRTGPQRNQVFVTQMIPWFGKLRLRGAVAAKEAEAIQFAYEAKILMLTRDISMAWYDYAYLGESTEITSRILELLKRLQETAREKVRGGNDLAPLLRLEVETVRTADTLQALEKQRVTESAALHALLGSDGSTPLPWPKLAAPDEHRPNRAALVASVLADNPELRALQSRIDKATETRKLSKLSPLPDPTVGAGFFDTGSAVNPATKGSGDDPWAIQIGFSIPLWAGKYKAEKREAEAAYEAAKQTLGERENALIAELESAIQKLSEVDERLSLYEETLLPKARQALEVTETSYKGDRSTVLDLIDSERTLLETERTYRRAVSDHYKAMIRLQTLTGKGAL